jgi:hypothetical protein
VLTLCRGAFKTDVVDQILLELALYGSKASPEFLKSEGVVIYHTGGNVMFKKTIEKDEEPKNATFNRAG